MPSGCFVTSFVSVGMTEWAAFDFDGLTEAQAAEALPKIKRMIELQRYHKLEMFQPYPKQAEFFEMGATKSERMFRAGNQQGKSEAGAFELACHLTGRYPAWWKGHRFHRPIRSWMCGESSTSVRDIQQAKLFGTPGVPEDLGTGFIPKECIIGATASHGATEAYDTAKVRHITGGTSTLTEKSYEQGRLKHQGEPVDVIWDDEESPMDIYKEHIARLLATNGIIFLTYTPLKGRTPLVTRFDRETASDRGLVKVSIWDCLGHLPHFATREMVEAKIAKFDAHERQARTYGDPILGEGAVFTALEEDLKFDVPQPIPTYWHKLWGIDFGINHPFGAMLIGWDKDNDIIYVLDGFRVEGATKLVHVPRIRAICSDAPVAWPHDGHDRDKGSGEELAEQYKQPAPGMDGLKMLPDHAQFEDGGYSTEAIIAEVIDRENTGRIKYARHLNEFFEERRDYHREKGLIVKKNDDMLSALFKAVMDRRHAKPCGMGGSRARYKPPQQEQIPEQWDIFSGLPIYG
jgi:phage terminase large subunit-like protein